MLVTYQLDLGGRNVLIPFTPEQTKDSLERVKEAVTEKYEGRLEVVSFYDKGFQFMFAEGQAPPEDELKLFFEGIK